MGWHHNIYKPLPYDYKYIANNFQFVVVSDIRFEPRFFEYAFEESEVSDSANPVLPQSN